MCRCFAVTLLFIFAVNFCCVEKAVSEAPAWWKWVEHESVVIGDGTVTFFRKIIPDAASTAWQWTKNESSIVENKTVVFFDETVPGYAVAVWHDVAGTADRVGEDLKKFFVKTMPAFFKETGNEIKIITTEIENKTLEELKEFENFIADHCHCEGYSCACCGHLEERQIELNATLCVNITYLPKDYGISFLMTLNSYVLYNETVSARSPPPFCVGMPFVKELAEICVRLYDIDATSTYLHACVRIEGRMKKILVAKYDFGCFDIGHKIGKWTMKNEVNDKVYKLEHVPIHYDVMYPKLMNTSSGQLAVNIPLESEAVGYCNKDVWVLNITWASPILNSEQDYLALTFKTGNDVIGETNVIVYFNGSAHTQVFIKKPIPELKIPNVLLECCYKDLNIAKEDNNSTLTFTMAITQEDLAELTPAARNLIWFFSVAGFVLIITIAFVVVNRRYKCCSKTKYVRF